MGKIEETKKIYNAIEIPEELKKRVAQTIEKERLLYMHQKKKKHHARYGMCTVAAAAALFVLGLNTNSAFAAAAQNVPVLGSVAKILTFRSYQYMEGETSVFGEIPGVEIKAATVKEMEFSAQVNEKIQNECDAYLEGAIERVEEYRQAFLETGGTEEEFAEKNIEIKVSYQIKSESENVLSFLVQGTESWVAAYAMNEYYNLDLKHMTYLTLADVLGEDYIDIANTSIRAQMDAQMQAGTAEYFTEEEGGFSGISEDSRFYINEEGLPVIVFEKYEVAPGAEGMVEFVIDKAPESNT